MSPTQEVELHLEKCAKSSYRSYLLNVSTLQNEGSQLQCDLLELRNYAITL